jgi:hypothetical protein
MGEGTWRLSYGAIPSLAVLSAQGLACLDGLGCHPAAPIPGQTIVNSCPVCAELGPFVCNNASSGPRQQGCNPRFWHHALRLGAGVTQSCGANIRG